MERRRSICKSQLEARVREDWLKNFFTSVLSRTGVGRQVFMHPVGSGRDPRILCISWERGAISEEDMIGQLRFGWGSTAQPQRVGALGVQIRRGCGRQALSKNLQCRCFALASLLSRLPLAVIVNDEVACKSEILLRWSTRMSYECAPTKTYLQPLNGQVTSASESSLHSISTSGSCRPCTATWVTVSVQC